MARIAGVILAGGRSTRMGGGDKALARLAGRPVLAHVIARLRPQVGSVALNANGDPARLEAFGLPVVADPLPDMGPLGGVLAGLRWATVQDDPPTHVATVACDTPFFPRDLVARLLQAAGTPERIVQARSGDRLHPTFALWPVSLVDDLEDYLRREGPASMRAYAGGRHQPAIVGFPIDEGHDPFFNINTPGDLEEAERRLSETKE